MSWTSELASCLDLDRQATKQKPRGEIGVLRSVVFSHAQPPARCFLYIEHEISSYMGCLLFDDYNFRRQVVTLLESYCNGSIAEIGSIDLSHTL
jgi:hypothetical protein